jgi:hypothetical protein
LSGGQAFGLRDLNAFLTSWFLCIHASFLRNDGLIIVLRLRINI